MRSTVVTHTNCKHFFCQWQFKFCRFVISSESILTIRLNNSQAGQNLFYESVISFWRTAQIRFPRDGESQILHFLNKGLHFLFISRPVFAFRKCMQLKNSGNMRLTFFSTAEKQYTLGIAGLSMQERSSELSLPLPQILQSLSPWSRNVESMRYLRIKIFQNSRAILPGSAGFVW